MRFPDLKPVTLFLQRRSSKAGAQVGLARLITNPAMRVINPVLVTMREGWLTEQCAKVDIPYLIQDFPRSRSWKGQLFANRAFGRDLLQAAQGRGWNPVLVQGNDHLEGLLALEVMRRGQISGIMFLRSSEMTHRDFSKYRCDRFSMIYAVGEELAAKAKKWAPQVEVRTLADGIDESDFLSAKTKAAHFPTKILVVGSESHYKGWADLAAAVDLLEENDEFPCLTFDFTGEAPDARLNDMHLSRRRRAKFRFIGRTDKFAELVRQYDLIIHPSREESFGIAPMEIIAAGVPLLCSRTGAIMKIRTAKEWLFEPLNPPDLAFRLGFLHEHWTTITVDIAECQKRIRDQFLMSRVVGDIVGGFQTLIAKKTLFRI